MNKEPANYNRPSKQDESTPNKLTRKEKIAVVAALGIGALIGVDRIAANSGDGTPDETDRVVVTVEQDETVGDVTLRGCKTLGVDPSDLPQSVQWVESDPENNLVGKEVYPGQEIVVNEKDCK